MAPRDKTACQTFPCKCKICISSIESDVYNKKKIQMFVVNMTFISSREVKKCIFHSCLRHSWNIHFFTSLDEIKVIFTPNIWISSIYRIHNSRSGLDLMKVVHVSKAQALQRSGRAGREAPGTCYRLYTEEQFGSLRTNTVPEIQRYGLGFKYIALDKSLFFFFNQKVLIFFLISPQKDMLWVYITSTSLTFF